MARTQQTIVNRRNGPIYVSIEPIPECYELEPSERLTLRYKVVRGGDSLEIEYINDGELVIWPMAAWGEPKVLINGQSAEGRNWTFKHDPSPSPSSRT